MGTQNPWQNPWQIPSQSPGPRSELRIRLMGDLQVQRQGASVALPASKRTRALLGYLVATGTPQSRQVLCDLLWDGPDDPRAELRWCLTKLRPVLDDADAQRVQADRERVAFDPCGAAVDTAELRALLAAGLEHASVAALEQAAALAEGEFLAGLDLPACWRFHQWCLAAREAHATQRRQVLAALVQRLAAEPERALQPARALAAADPLSEPAHAAVVRLLAALGRTRDAQAHARQAEAMFRRELGIVPGAEMRDALRQVHAGLQARAAQARALAEAPPHAIDQAPAFDEAADPSDDDGTAAVPPPLPLVGRATERAAIDAAVGSLAGTAARPLLLFVGEPGIGKTRLLDTLGERARQAGARVLQARCFEAEMMRPYGCWIDALRAMPPALVPASLQADLAPLLSAPTPAASRQAPRGGQRNLGAARRFIESPPATARASPAEPAEPGDRGRLFDAVCAWLKGLAETQPLSLVLDDLQWLDEASCSLLHFVARHAVRPSRLLIAGAARQGEIDDNPWTRGLLQSLARLGGLRQHAVAPLSMAEMALLLSSAALDTDAAAEAAATVHRVSGGNPLYALTFARSQRTESQGHGESGDSEQGTTWQTLIAGELQRLGEGERELVGWAAAFGRECRIDLLGAALALPESAVLARLERLERRGLLKPIDAQRYDFAHDLVREAVMRALSPPRRRALHRHLAQVLDKVAEQDASLYGEVAHHAAQAGDDALTVRASLAAADFCLRVFANAQAADAARRGLASLARLPPGRERAGWHIGLLRQLIVAVAYPVCTPLPALRAELQQAIETARLLGLDSQAASGLHMLSWATQNANDTEATLAATWHAERMSRSSDPAARCQQLANTGRCLLEVEADLPQARALLATAADLAEALGLHVIELEWGRGLIARWEGDLDTAWSCVQRAVDLARLHQDRWREFECLVWLATLQFERGEFAAVDGLCAEIGTAVARMGTLQSPMNDSLRALAMLARADSDAGQRTAQQALDAAAQALRALDDKAHLAYVLNQTAMLALGHGLPARARTAAAEALQAAEAVRRGTEVLAARALLALAACAAGRPDEAADGLRESRYTESFTPSARARSLLERADDVLHSNARSNAAGARFVAPTFLNPIP